MSKQAAFARQTELLEDLRVALRGTSHTVTVVVSGDKVKLSDANLHIKNGDTVIWSPSGIGTGDKLVIKFSGLRSQILSSRHQGTADGSVRVNLAEEPGVETTKEFYSLFLLKRGETTDTPLTYDGLSRRFTGDGPTLVVDDMPKPPPDPRSPPGGGEGHRHGRRPR